MASDLSPYFGNKICRWLNNDAAMPSSPAALYIGLFHGNPKTTGTEVSTTIHSGGRVAVTFTTLASGSDHTLTSDADVDFGLAAGAATLDYISLWDAASSGNLLASKAIVGGAQAIAVGAGVKFLSGGISFNVGADA